MAEELGWLKALLLAVGAGAGSGIGYWLAPTDLKNVGSVVGGAGGVLLTDFLIHCARQAGLF